MTAEPSAEERAAVDEVLGPPETGWEGGDRTTRDLRVSRAPEDQRTLLLPVLHALQGRVGWISEGGLNYACERLQVPPAEAYGVATFYAMFSVTERPPTVVHVCDDLACRINGAEEVCRRFEEGRPGSWVRSPCLGSCESAPVLLVQQAGEDGSEFAAEATTHVVDTLIGGGPLTAGLAHGSAPQAQHVTTRDELRLLGRVGSGGGPEEARATSIDAYRDHGGYEALARAIELGPDAVIQQVIDAKLLGRGGAAFPTGVKWRGVADQAVTPKYVICNADESEPGTFKDRVIMEQDPFAVIESLTIAGYATGAEQGLLYIRGEYPTATERIAHAIAEARGAGLIGDDVMGAGFAFDIELRRGAGAYICGEETALFNSIEGKRGEPRNKPPFPVTHGLFGKPTSINNVETLINVLQVLTMGPEAYAALGTEGSTGTRLFCLSGHVERPGVYEHEHGITLGAAVEAAGGVRGGKPLKAILLGGAAGGFVGPDRLDIRLTFEDARAGGYTLGSGVIMVFDEDTDLVDLCLRIARFFRDESCGQCVPCRVGTVRQEEALHRLVAGRTFGSREDELVLLGDVATVMRDASICGLGQTAASAVQSAIATFGLFEGEATA
ncbi:MAG TPA: NAD(P)H-dependent oxidoreductase subunit E [Actinomycetota bacterium]|nr:NAD(P)H-dependent oxidoreductase subunit E [Actinomycetota bacterium]